MAPKRRLLRVRILHLKGYKIVDLNRRKAIRERCLNCSSWILKGVRDCEFTDCPLHPFRSGKGKQDAKERTRGIREYCLWCMYGQHIEVVKCVSKDCPLFPYRLSAVDRSVELTNLSENDHIEATREAKGKP